MNNSLLCLGLALHIAALTSDLQAGKATDLSAGKPAGKLLLEDSFSSSAPGKLWTVNKGEWVIQEGAMLGKEKKSDKHAAVLTLNQPNRDSIIQFSFKLDGASGFNLSFNHARGHLFRILIEPDGLTLSKDKDKKNPASKVEMLAKAAGPLKAGQWHTLRVAIQGAKVTAQTDSGLKVEGSHPGLDMDKTGYRFVCRGEALQLDDLKVWQLDR